MLTPTTVVSNLRRARANHFIVVGGDGLAYRLADELTRRYGADVVVVMTAELSRPNHDFAELPKVKVLLCDRIDAKALRKADLQTSSGLVLGVQDDVGNIHTALQVRDDAPRIRLVIRMSNLHLGQGMEKLLGNCRVLSDAEIAAPALIASVLDEVPVSPLPVRGRMLTVARRGEVPAEDIVCALADTGRPDGPEMLPADTGRADLVLVQLRQTWAEEVAQAAEIRRQRWWRWWQLSTLLSVMRTLVSRKTWIAVTVVFGIMTAAGIALSLRGGHGVWEGVYLTLVNGLGGVQEGTELGVAGQVLQLIIGIAGLAFVPLVTALVVEGMVNAKLAVTDGRLKLSITDHVVVIGLGNVGTRVLRLLHDRGVPVVAIDREERNARGVALARELGIPLIIGDASRESTLRAAGVEHCRALMTLASNDVINLEAALHGRNLQPGLQVLIRIFDGDLAKRIRRTFDLGLSRSVSYVAAPAFAEALMEREVVGVIPVERRVLLLAEVVVSAGCVLDGAPIADADHANEAKVIAVDRAGEQEPHFRPRRDQPIQATDRLIVVTTRDGLSRLMRQTASSPVASSPAADSPVADSTG